MGQVQSNNCKEDDLFETNNDVVCLIIMSLKDTLSAHCAGQSKDFGSHHYFVEGGILWKVVRGSTKFDFSLERVGLSLGQSLV